MGDTNKNIGTTWEQQYNKGVVIITIRGYTSSIGTQHAPLLQKLLSSMLE